MKDEELMARDNYGYGDWNAPYWFIGPEQGMNRRKSKGKTQADLDREADEERVNRLNAWIDLGKRNLNDCLEFHRRIGATEITREEPALQPAWRRLIIARLAFDQKVINRSTLRSYQKSDWGLLLPDKAGRAETCVIELSGLAAKRLGGKSEIHTDLDEKFLKERITYIRKRMFGGRNRPKFVVLYGKAPSCRAAWEGISEDSEQTSEAASNFMTFRKHGHTVIAWARHPRWTKDEQWVRLGDTIRKLSKNSQA